MPRLKTQQPKSLPLISVIVPIYKVEKYLKRCVDSILSQEYKNLQIILVDDGSPDKCPEICDKYAEQDSRITVIHKVNGGVSSARNTGLGAIKGEYISFIDPDDYVDKQFISTLYGLAQKYNADISMCGYIEVFEDSPKTQLHSDAVGEIVLSKLEAMANTLVDFKYGHVVPWNKLYKANIFTDNVIQYPEKVRVHEDNFVTYKLFYYAKRIAYSGEPLYHYLKRSEGLISKTNVVDGISHWQAKMEQFSEVDLFIREHNLPLTKELDASFLAENLHYIGLLANTGKLSKADKAELRANVVSKFPKCLLNDKLPFDKKIAAILIWFGWAPYTAVDRSLKFIGH